MEMKRLSKNGQSHERRCDLKIVSYKQGDKIVDILHFMFQSVTKDKEPCIVTMNNILVMIAPDEKRVIEFPEGGIKIPEA